MKKHNTTLKVLTLIAVIIAGAMLSAAAAFPAEPGPAEMRQKAEKLRSERKYAQALKAYEAALQSTRETYGENSVKVAEVLVGMSLIYRYDLGKGKKYFELQKKAKQVQLTLNGTVSCGEPRHLRYEPCRERWLGPDPCFRFASFNEYVKVTYYGLEGSTFAGPEDFIKNLRGLFGRFEAMDTVTIGGREATRVKLRYDRRDHYDRDGHHRPQRFLYEEFIIVPLKKGYLVFNFNLNQHSPIPVSFDGGEGMNDIHGKARAAYRAWSSFIESCRINQ